MLKRSLLLSTTLFFAGCAVDRSLRGRMAERAQVGASAAIPFRDARPLADAIRELSVGHLLEQGDGRVVQLLRRRIDREAGHETLELLTLDLPVKLRGGRAKVPEEIDRATYSFAVFSEKLYEHARSSEVRGELRLEPLGNGYLVEFDGVAVMHGNGQRDREIRWSTQISGEQMYSFTDRTAEIWREGIWFLAPRDR